MKKKNTKSAKKQSNLSRALASSNQQSRVLDRFFELSSAEIRHSVALVKRHRHFVGAVELASSGAVMFYARRGPEISIDRNLSWCLGVLEVHSERVQEYLDAQPKILSLILHQKHSEVVKAIDDLEALHSLSTWGIGLKASALALSDPERRRAYLGELLTAADDNGFFKAIAFNLVTRFDDPEILPSESKFFEQKIKRSFTGKLLHFLMYKLLPHSVDFVYDFEHILQMERESSHIDVFLCIVDFLIEGLHTTDEKTLQLCKKTVADLNRLFQSDLLEDLAISYGLALPPSPDSTALEIVDFYTAGDYEAVCSAMDANADLARRFALVEVWAKSLARVPHRMPTGSMSTFLIPLCDLLLKNASYEKSKALLLAYSHALSAIPWFKELRYLVDRESRFYSPVINDRLRQTALLISHFTSPAKSLVLSTRYPAVAANFSLSTALPSVTVRLFERMQSDSNGVPESSELQGIESDRKTKFLAMWHSARGKFDEAIPLLQQLRESSDLRVAHDASKSLVAAYLSANMVEEAADVYVDSVLQNINLLSAFDSTRLCAACAAEITSSGSIAIPIVFSIYSRHIGDGFNAALKYSFERFLKNNGLTEPADTANLSALDSYRIDYFLRYVCTPEVMKLYLHFDSTKEIEECRVAICKLLIERGVVEEELVLEIKYRTRHLFLRDATSQVEHSRIYSDANLLTGTAALTFRALFDRYIALRSADSTPSEDEIAHADLVSLVQKDPVVRQSAHSLHTINVVLSEKNSTFLKLLKLVRDEFAFGEKGLNVYLSTRIRHGHFPNTMRKPVQDNDLLTSKVTEAGSYKLNSPWVTSLNLTPVARQILEHALTDFTAKFNALVDEVNDSWLSRLLKYSTRMRGTLLG